MLTEIQVVSTSIRDGEGRWNNGTSRLKAGSVELTDTDYAADHVIMI